MQHVHFVTTDSTNTEALRAWRQSADSEPLLVSADTQTAGVGRNGRRWLSPSSGLWLTLAWPLRRSTEHYAALPLAIGGAVAATLEREFGLDCCVKWPNDVLVADRKLVGVLCRVELEQPPAILVGVGINGNFEATVLGGELRHPPTTLLDELGHPVDLPALRDAIVRELTVALREFDKHGLAGQLDNVRARLAWGGQDARVTQPGPTHETETEITGRIVGLDDGGHLLLEHADGRHTVCSGDVTRCSRA